MVEITKTGVLAVLHVLATIGIVRLERAGMQCYSGVNY